MRHIGGAPGTWQNAQLIPTDWGIIAFRPSDGASDKVTGFQLSGSALYWWGPGTWPNAQIDPLPKGN